MAGPEWVYFAEIMWRAARRQEEVKGAGRGLVRPAAVAGERWGREAGAQAANQDLQGGNGPLCVENTSSSCQRETRTSVCSLHPCSATRESTNQPWAISLWHGSVKGWSWQAAGAARVVAGTAGQLCCMGNSRKLVTQDL